MNPPGASPDQASPLGPPAGAVALKLHVFGPADRELAEVLTPPWPRWMRRLYELEALSGDHIDLVEGEVAISAALSALRAHLARRLEMLAWVCAELARHGWEFSLRGGDVVAQTTADVGTVRLMLERTRLAAVLPTVCAVDGDGFPQLLSGAELEALADG
ncbi:MAG: hypothetical protein WCB85_02875 [Candidatus Dormiibacterota bacterium]